MRALIAAHGPNYLIGNHGQLPWGTIKSDAAFFKRTTLHSTVGMGHSTWRSLPDQYRPLPKRRNLVFSTDPSLRLEGAEVVRSMDDFLEKTSGDANVFFIGGYRVFLEALPIVDRMYLTSIYGSFDGDVYFPPFNPMWWKRALLEQHSGSEGAEPSLVIWQYDRLTELAPTLPEIRTPVLVEHARSAEQAEALRAIVQGGYCPFCPEFFRQEHQQPIWQQGKYWYLTPSRWPYGDGKLRIQMMLIAIEHVTSLRDLPREARVEMMDLAVWAEEAFGVESGALIMRFGKLGYNGSSVDHLHAHITSGDYGNPFFEPVRFKIAAIPQSSG